MLHGFQYGCATHGHPQDFFQVWAMRGSEGRRSAGRVQGRDCNPGLLFQSRDFGIEKCQSRDESLILN